MSKRVRPDSLTERRRARPQLVPLRHLLQPLPIEQDVAAFERDELAIGRMLTFDLGASHVPRCIINFPAKKHWRDPSKLQYIEEGLVGLIAEIRRLGIRSIAVPALGAGLAGLGGLDWPIVRGRIEVHLGALPEVEVELYAPG